MSAPEEGEGPVGKGGSLLSDKSYSNALNSGRRGKLETIPGSIGTGSLEESEALEIVPFFRGNGGG